MNNSSDKLFRSIVTFLLIVSPILQTYGWGGRGNFSVAALAIVVLIALLRGKIGGKLPQWLALYMAYHMLVHVITVQSVSSLIPFGILFHALVFMLYLRNTHIDEIEHCYKVIGAICIGFFCVQEWLYHTVGYRIGGVAKFLPLSIADDPESYYSTIEITERSASFFSEPAHFAQFLLPLLAIVLFDSNKRNRIWIVLILLTLLYTQSGCAMLGLGAICFVYLLKILRSSAAKTKIIGLGVFALGLSLVAILYFRSGMGTKLVDRQEELSGDMAVSSGFIRIFRGYYVFGAYAPLEKVFGMDDDQTILKRVNQSPVGYMSDFGSELYFNVVQSVLIRTGYIGAILFVIMLIHMWRGSNDQGKAIILTFVVLSFITANFFSNIMMLYFVLVYQLKAKERKQVCGQLKSIKCYG